MKNILMIPFLLTVGFISILLASLIGMVNVLTK